MLLLDVLPVQLSYLQFSLIIIAVIAAASGITYYLANLGSNAILDCNDMYQPDTNISLNLSDAQYMINSYKQNNIDTDTCAVWFSLKSIQNFACNIETNTKQYCNQNCSQFISPDGLGVRIYFAKYPGGGSNNKQMQ